MLLQQLRVSTTHQQEAVIDRFLCPFPFSRNILLKEKAGSERAGWQGVSESLGTPEKEEAANIFF